MKKCFVVVVGRGWMRKELLNISMMKFIRIIFAIITLLDQDG
jgi:hypothetical protein